MFLWFKHYLLDQLDICSIREQCYQNIESIQDMMQLQTDNNKGQDTNVLRQAAEGGKEPSSSGVSSDDLG